MQVIHRSSSQPKKVKSTIWRRKNIFFPRSFNLIFTYPLDSCIISWCTSQVLIGGFYKSSNLNYLCLKLIRRYGAPNLFSFSLTDNLVRQPWTPDHNLKYNVDLYVFKQFLQPTPQKVCPKKWRGLLLNHLKVTTRRGNQFA